MRQIVYGPICLLQDPRFVYYDYDADMWYLDENALNVEFCSVANAGAKGIRLLPWGVWEAHLHGASSQFQPYKIVGNLFDLATFNSWYFPIVRRVIEIANKYELTVWWCLLDNCQFSGPYRKWSPWYSNLQGIGSAYETKAHPFFADWIQRCREEFAGLSVAWPWGNETVKAGMDDLVKACVFPVLPGMDPARMTYGATMQERPYVDGEYTGDAGMLDKLKLITGAALGDSVKLAIWKEVHGIGGKGYPAIPNRFDQALKWWARPKNNGIRAWLSDDGVKDGDSACDVDTDGARPSAERWAEIIKSTLKYGNDFTYEHLPQSADLACQTKTLKAMYKAMTGKDPVEKYHYTPATTPPEPTPGPAPDPTPEPTPPKLWIENNWGWVVAVIILATVLALIL